MNADQKNKKVRFAKKNYLTFLLLLVFVIGSTIEKTNGMTMENVDFLSLVENRTLEIHLVGFSNIKVDSTYLFQRLNKEIISQFPLGQMLSTINITPKILHVSESKRDSLTEQVFIQSTVNQKSIFYIPYRNFSNIIINEFHADTSELNTIKLIVINFKFNDSLLGFNDLYINYTNEDIDTQSYSQVMEFSNEGVSFELPKTPILGIITSSNPRFETNDFPSIQYLIDNLITPYEWNERLADVIEKVLWCRLNPSPIFRYNPHEKVVIHISMVSMDTEYSIYEIINFVNFTVIKDRLEELLGITEIQIITTITNANSLMQNLLQNKSENYLQWSNSLASYLKNSRSSFWDIDYRVKDQGFTEILDLFASIIVGSKNFLPYSDEYGGLSHYSMESSETGGLSVVTMNYDSLFIKKEGLTRTTLHELGHLFGLIHPHDYWHPIDEVLKYSWELGYTSSPMTYLTTGYEWGYFDYMTLWRTQVFSFFNSMQKYDYEDIRIGEELEKIKNGEISSLSEHLDVIKNIYYDYKDREDFHHFFEGALISGIALGFITLMLVIVMSYRKIKNV